MRILSHEKPDGLPSLDFPTLWYHQDHNTVFGGFAGAPGPFTNQSSGTPPQSLWTFDASDQGTVSWSELIDSQDLVWQDLRRPFQQYRASGGNKAWTLNGDDERNSPVGRGPTPGLVTFDMSTRSFTNSTSSLSYQNDTSRGDMQYVPLFGSEGILIAMGGTRNTLGLVGFNPVQVYDPASESWYNQSTTGSAPADRIEFCTAGVGTNDSYEM